MLTSIGFGYVCPTTFEGRLFGVIYCLIGQRYFLCTFLGFSIELRNSANPGDGGQCG